MNETTTNPTTRGLTRSSKASADTLAWFSIGLGITQLLLPRVVRRVCGLRSSARSIRLCGVREMACGIGILKAPAPAPWVWGRVAGDALDLTMVGSQGRGNLRSLLAFAAVAGMTVLDARFAARLKEEAQRRARVPPDFGDRSGFASDPEAVRGSALDDFEAPSDMTIPPALRPWSAAQEAAKPPDAHLQLVAAMPIRPSTPDAVAAPEFIDANDPGSLDIWKAKLLVTDEQLRQAIQSVGARATDVELHLKGTRSITNADRVDDARLL
jgi:hypothetical protein